MCNCPSFEKTLQYVSPAHGGWGMIRVAALLPESHQLFVIPSACGRHGALGGIMNGIKDRIHYLYIDEADIVSGHYEDLIPKAVTELFEYLETLPKALLIFVSCLDDLLGTDHKALCTVLTQMFPQVRFISCHMNPFKMDTKVPPAVGLQVSLFGNQFRENLPKKNQINMIGNNAFIDEKCELYELMKNAGYSVHHIGLCKTYEDYLQMQYSKLNLVLHPAGGLASQKMERNAGIKMQMALNTYDPEETEAIYHQIEENLGISLGDFSQNKLNAENAIKKAKEIIGDYPVVIDYQSVLKPFTLGRLLARYDFNVKMIFCDGIAAFDKEACSWLVENVPDFKIVEALHPDSVKFENKMPECLCIGFSGGYLTKSIHVVDLMEDEYLYGFWGTEQLMEKLIYAFQNITDVNQIIAGAKLVV